VKADARTPGCQTCHGTSDAHVKNPQGSRVRPSPDVVFGPKSNNPVGERNDVCLVCHKSGARTYWSGSTHQYRDVACATCHQVHAPRDPVLAKITQPDVCFGCHKSQRAQIHLISTHPILIGKVACSDCHNPHGSTAPKLMVKETINETCYTCHAEKRGPFLWEHAPVRESCLNCHDPHGSNHDKLLVAKQPFLCQRCHLSTRHPGTLYDARNSTAGATVAAVSNREVEHSCRNCHVNIHGSNAPSGEYLGR
jgi:DmsE family decaheme c-type cytochrome